MVQMRKKSLRIDLLMILAISTCLIFANLYSTSMVKKILGTSDVVCLDKDSFTADTELVEEVSEVLTAPVEKVEMYDNRLHLMYASKFDGSFDLNKCPKLKEKILHEKSYQLAVDIDNKHQVLRFDWIEGMGNDHRRGLLMTYYLVYHMEKMWPLTFFCILVVLFTYVLVIRIKMREYDNNIRQYTNLMNEYRRE